MSIGSRIRERREAIGMRQAELATAIGAGNSSTISGYEKSASIPRYEYLAPLMKALKCDANFLFQDEMRELQLRTDTFSALEMTLVSKFRQLDEAGKRTVSAVLSSELQRVDDEKNAGKRSVEEFLDTLEDFLRESEKEPANTKEGGCKYGDSKIRLRNALRSLNRGQIEYILSTLLQEIRQNQQLLPASLEIADEKA